MWFRMYPPLSLPKVDVFAHDIILIPIHLGMHWCLATIHFRQQQFQYFDSLGGNNLSCLNRLRCAAIRSWNLTETILASFGYYCSLVPRPRLAFRSHAGRAWEHSYYLCMFLYLSGLVVRAFDYYSEHLRFKPQLQPYFSSLWCYYFSCSWHIMKCFEQSLFSWLLHRYRKRFSITNFCPDDN